MYKHRELAIRLVVDCAQDDSGRDHSQTNLPIHTHTHTHTHTHSHDTHTCPFLSSSHSLDHSWFFHTDKNECLNSRCHECANLPGGFECQCREGYYHSNSANTCFGKEQSLCCLMLLTSTPIKLINEWQKLYNYVHSIAMHCIAWLLYPLSFRLY